MRALDFPAIDFLRAAVPEFEPTLQARLREEDGEVGPFEGMSLFAEWVLMLLRSEAHNDAVGRAFDAIERLITDDSLQLGDALAAEFIEATWDDPQAAELMGPMTRARAAA